MAFSAFCKIKDIPGEAMAKDHAGEIQIEGYSHQVSQNSNMGSKTGGLTAGGANFGKFKISHFLDKSTADLNLKCIKGNFIEEIEITVNRSGDGPKEYMKYILKKCLITEVRIDADTHIESDKPLEHVTFAYDEINWKYTAYNEDDSKEGEYTAGWKLDTSEAV